MRIGGEKDDGLHVCWGREICRSPPRPQEPVDIRIGTPLQIQELKALSRPRLCTSITHFLFFCSKWNSTLARALTTIYMLDFVWMVGHVLWTSVRESKPWPLWRQSKVIDALVVHCQEQYLCLGLASNKIQSTVCETSLCLIQLGMTLWQREV